MISFLLFLSKSEDHCLKLVNEGSCPDGSVEYNSIDEFEETLKTLNNSQYVYVFNNENTKYTYNLDTTNAEVWINFFGSLDTSFIEVLATQSSYKYIFFQDMSVSFKTPSNISAEFAKITNCKVDFNKTIGLNLKTNILTTTANDIAQFTSVRVKNMCNIDDMIPVSMDTKLIFDSVPTIYLNMHVKTDITVSKNLITIQYKNNHKLEIFTITEIKKSPTISFNLTNDTVIHYNSTNDHQSQTNTEITANGCLIEFDCPLNRSVGTHKILLKGGTLKVYQNYLRFPVKINGKSAISGPLDGKKLEFEDGSILNTINGLVYFKKVILSKKCSIVSDLFIKGDSWSDLGNGNGEIHLSKIQVEKSFSFGGAAVKIKELVLAKDAYLENIFQQGWNTQFFPPLECALIRYNKNINIASCAGRSYNDAIANYLDDCFFGTKFRHHVIDTTSSLAKACKIVKSPNDRYSTSDKQKIIVEDGNVYIEYEESPKSRSQTICIGGSKDSSKCRKDPRRFYSTENSSKWINTITDATTNVLMEINGDQEIDFTNLDKISQMQFVGNKNTVKASFSNINQLSRLIISDITLKLSMETIISIDTIQLGANGFIKNANLKNVRLIKIDIERISEVHNEIDVVELSVGNRLKGIEYLSNGWNFFLENKNFIYQNDAARDFLIQGDKITELTLTCNGLDKVRSLTINGVSEFIIKGKWPYSEVAAAIVTGTTRIYTESGYIPVGVNGQTGSKSIYVDSNIPAEIMYPIRSASRNFCPIFEGNNKGITIREHSGKGYGAGLGTYGNLTLGTSYVGSYTSCTYGFLKITKSITVEGSTNLSLYNVDLSSADMTINVQYGQTVPRIEGYGKIMPKQLTVKIEPGAEDRGKEVPLICDIKSNKIPPLKIENQDAQLKSIGNCIYLTHKAILLPIWLIVLIAVMSAVFIGLCIWIGIMVYQIIQINKKKKKTKKNLKQHLNKSKKVTSDNSTPDAEV